MILAISGKKQSGKGTIFRFIHALNNLVGRPTHEFFFAYLLKRMCVDILGLREEQAFGTDADKNMEVTHLLWENFPIPAFTLPTDEVYIWQKGKPDPMAFWVERDRPYGEFDVYDVVDGQFVLTRTVARHELITPGKGPIPRTGPMTGREVLQYWGSEIFRYQYHDIWADATIRMVEAWLANNEGGMAVVTDARFPNEILATTRASGVTIRLTRNVFDDRHQSETSLDDWTAFDFVLDNHTMSVKEQCISLYPWLYEHGLVPALSPSTVLEAADAAGAGS